MSDAKAQQEPTMEEILASIRRIISEDDKPADNAAPAAEPEADEDETVSFDAEPEAEPEADDDDVLELTEVVSDDLDDAPEPVDDFDAPEPELEPDGDVDFEPSPGPYAEATPAAAALHEAYRGLVSDPTAAHATSSFSQLAGAVTATRGVPLGNHQKTLEELMKELLRPMLKEWLDRHLPPLVERLVEREIAKLAGGADEK